MKCFRKISIWSQAVIQVRVVELIINYNLALVQTKTNIMIHFNGFQFGKCKTFSILAHFPLKYLFRESFHPQLHSVISSQ